MHPERVQNERIPNVWSGLGACKRDSTRSFHHTCLRAPAHGHKYKGKKKICLREKKNTTTGINHRNDVLRAPSGTRTLDTLIKSQVLYQLS